MCFAPSRLAGGGSNTATPIRRVAARSFPVHRPVESENAALLLQKCCAANTSCQCPNYPQACTEKGAFPAFFAWRCGGFVRPSLHRTTDNVEPPEREGRLQDRPDGTGWIDDEIGRWLDHGTRQLPRVKANPVRQLESRSSLEKGGCFGRCPDKVTKGFPGEAGPRKGPGQTAAGSFRRTPCRGWLRTAERQAAIEDGRAQG